MNNTAKSLDESIENLEKLTENLKKENIEKARKIKNLELKVVKLEGGM